MKKEIRKINEEIEVFITEDGKEFKREKDAIKYEENNKKRLYKEKVSKMSNEELNKELAKVLHHNAIINYAEDIKNAIGLLIEYNILDDNYLTKSHYDDNYEIVDIGYEGEREIFVSDITIERTICIYVIFLQQNLLHGIY